MRFEEQVFELCENVNSIFGELPKAVLWLGIEDLKTVDLITEDSYV